MSSRHLAIPLLFCCALAATGNAQTLHLSEVGGGTLGKLTTMTVTGTPGDQYLVILSLSNGPTPLPPPHQPSTLDVGIELFSLSFTIPGFNGLIGAGGTATAFLPVPLDPILLAIPSLNFQAIRIVNNARIDGKSNPCKLVPALDQSTRKTLGNMGVRRAGHAVVKLQDGAVLFFGGGADGTVASYGQTNVDRYDPCTQTFTTVAQMLSPRTSHTATQLNDGRILVVGGADDFLGEPINTAELFDPTTHTSIPVANLSVARALHSATLLPDGRVLVAGGTSSFANPQEIIDSGKDTTEIFNPATLTWVAGPKMVEPRVGHRADTLLDGRILVSGGYSFTDLILFKLPRISSTAQIYLPGGGIGAFGSAINMVTPRFGHVSAVANNGTVYLFGGATDQSSPLNPVEVDTIERFNPLTNTFTQLPATMSKARGAAGIAKLPDNTVVVCGGSFGNLAVPSQDDSIDLFDIASEGILNVYTMLHVRSNFSAILLDNGTVLLAGGGEEFLPSDPSNPVSYPDAEILHP